MKSKRILSAVLTLVLMLSTVFSVNVFAATSSKVYTALKGKLPLVTYAMPLSGESKVYAYKDSSLKTKESSYYISTFSDQIVITEISSNGKAVKATYPSSSASSGYRTKWFKADDILGLTSVDINSYTASKGSTTYRMKSKSATTSYGSIAKNDSCVRLGTHKIGSTTYYPTVYNISSTKVNKVNGIKNKLALATIKENKGITLNPTSLNVVKGKTATITATLVNTGSNSISAKSSNTSIATVSVSGKKVTVKGVKNGTATVTITSGNYSAKATVTVSKKSNGPVWPVGGNGGKDLNNWHKYSNGSYHGGTDISAPKGTDVYSTYDGVVDSVIEKKENGKYVSYGKYVIVKCEVNGETVYIYYCHLNSYCVKKGDKVVSGQKIGTVGETGNATGPHLHYEVRDENKRYGNNSSPNLNPYNYLPKK